MAAVAVMVMYEDESVEVTYAHGARLLLSPCGAEYVLEQARPRSGHPLQTRETVRQRTRFTVSKNEALLVEALNFRNKYATRPYLPEELIPADHRLGINKFSPVVWEVVCAPAGVHGVSDGVLVRADGGRAQLVLAGCGEAFTVEFMCKNSQSEGRFDSCWQETSTPAQRSRGLENSIPADPVQEGGSRVNVQWEQSAALGRAYTHVRVVQHHSRVQHPPVWRYPLSLALSQWESERTKCSSAIGQQSGGGPEEHHTPGSSPQRAMKDRLPPPLPLSCPSPHLHRWRYGDLASDWSDLETTELVRVVWCHGIIYRVMGGAVPMVEVLPGDGSVIRSNGVLVEYFTHYRRGPTAFTVEESVYYLSGLPPDRPGQRYSISSVVTKASRILQAYRQASNSRIPATAPSCWKKEVGEEQRSEGAWKIGARAGLCQISVPDGQEHLVQVHAGGAYHSAVLGELQKIRRFNFLLENSPLLNLQRDQSQICSMTSDLSNLTISDETVCEALEKTSKAIQDINSLLNQKLLT